jgi:hypothetical protein
MNKLKLALSAGFVLAAGVASAQSTQDVDCSLAVNADNPACVVVPVAGDVQNFVPFIAPLVAVAVIAAAGGGGGGGSSAPSTPD